MKKYKISERIELILGEDSNVIRIYTYSLPRIISLPNMDLEKYFYINKKTLTSLFEDKHYYEFTCKEGIDHNTFIEMYSDFLDNERKEAENKSKLMNKLNLNDDELLLLKDILNKIC